MEAVCTEWTRWFWLSFESPWVDFGPQSWFDGKIVQCISSERMSGWTPLKKILQSLTPKSHAGRQGQFGKLSELQLGQLRDASRPHLNAQISGGRAGSTGRSCCHWSSRSRSLSLDQRLPEEVTMYHMWRSPGRTWPSGFAACHFFGDAKGCFNKTLSACTLPAQNSENCKCTGVSGNMPAVCWG